MVCMWRHHNANFKTMNFTQLHVFLLCFMATPNKFSHKILLLLFTCPGDIGKVIESRNTSHVVWRVKLVHYFIFSTFNGNQEKVSEYVCLSIPFWSICLVTVGFYLRNLVISRRIGAPPRSTNIAAPYNLLYTQCIFGLSYFSWKFFILLKLI